MSYPLAFSKSEFKRRSDAVTSRMREAGLDALVAYSVRNAQGPVAYLGGYEPDLGLHDVAYFLLIPGGKPDAVLVTNGFWDDPAARTWVEDVVISYKFERSLPELLPRSASRIGVVGYDYLPAPVYLGLKAALPRCEIVDATRLVLEVAQIKSPAEVEVIRRCMSIGDHAGRAFLEGVHEGAAERSLQIAVGQALMQAGADGIYYNPQIYSGASVADGMGMRTDRILQAGDQVQVDCGAVYRGYRGDLSRVTTVGRAAPEVRHIMETTAQVYEAMLATLRAGTAAADVARAGIRVAEANGLGDCLYRPTPDHPRGMLGHGIGCWIHELPDIRLDSADVLQPGMVVVFETILGQPGIGGAKIEDAVLVTEDAPERLSRLPIRTWPE